MGLWESEDEGRSRDEDLWDAALCNQMKFKGKEKEGAQVQSFGISDDVMNFWSRIRMRECVFAWCSFDDIISFLQQDRG